MISTYRPELDGLRAIAVAAVVLSHAGAPVPGGHLGVDIFFVLSGYLIARHVLQDLAQGSFRLGAFYQRRARRILPALGVVVLASVPAAWTLLPPDALQQFGQGLVALCLFATNVLFWRQAGYFEAEAAENPLIHTWSLAVEEQFYLLFPLLLILLWKGGARFTGYILVLLLACSLAGFAAFWSSHPDLVFYLTPFRAWALIAGALVAWAERYASTVKPQHGDWLGLCLIALAIAFGSHEGGQAWAWNLSAVAGTALVILCCRHGSGTARGLGLGPLRALGLVSYSTYLWHQPVFAFARVSQVEPLSAANSVALIALTLCLATATWALVEQPCRRCHVNWRHGRTGALVAGSVAVLGLVLHLGHGLPGLRFDKAQQDLFASSTPSPLRETCHGSVDDFKACTHAQGKPVTWAVLGDSHAVEIGHALGIELADRQISVLQMSASACPPATKHNPGQSACASWLEEAIARLGQEQDLETIVLAWRHGLYLTGGHGKSVTPERYMNDLSAIVERLAARGQRVIVMAPVPELPRDVSIHIADWAEAAPELPVQSRAAYEARHAAFMTDIEALPAHVIQPARALCDNSMCYAAPGGRSAYFDDDHLSMAGAARVVAEFMRRPGWAGLAER